MVEVVDSCHVPRKICLWNWAYRFHYILDVNINNENDYLEARQQALQVLRTRIMPPDLTIQWVRRSAILGWANPRLGDRYDVIYDQYVEMQFGQVVDPDSSWGQITEKYWSDFAAAAMQDELYHEGVDLYILGYEQECVSNHHQKAGWGDASIVKSYLSVSEQLAWEHRKEIALKRFWYLHGDFIQDMVRKAARHRGRERRAVELLMDGKVWIDHEGGVHKVVSSGGSGTVYQVDPKQGYCECFDAARHQHTSVLCKHQLAVLMSLRLRKRLRGEQT